MSGEGIYRRERRPDGAKCWKEPSAQQEGDQRHLAHVDAPRSTTKGSKHEARSRQRRESCRVTKEFSEERGAIEVQSVCDGQSVIKSATCPQNFEFVPMIEDTRDTDSSRQSLASTQPLNPPLKIPLPRTVGNTAGFPQSARSSGSPLHSNPETNVEATESICYGKIVFEETARDCKLAIIPRSSKKSITELGEDILKEWDLADKLPRFVIKPFDGGRFLEKWTTQDDEDKFGRIPVDEQWDGDEGKFRSAVGEVYSAVCRAAVLGNGFIRNGRPNQALQLGMDIFSNSGLLSKQLVVFDVLPMSKCEYISRKDAASKPIQYPDFKWISSFSDTFNAAQTTASTPVSKTRTGDRYGEGDWRNKAVEKPWHLLYPYLTHLILVEDQGDDRSRHDELRDSLVGNVPTIRLYNHGRLKDPAELSPGSWLMNEARTGHFVILLRGTGGATDKLAESVKMAKVDFRLNLLRALKSDGGLLFHICQGWQRWCSACAPISFLHGRRHQTLHDSHGAQKDIKREFDFSEDTRKEIEHEILPHSVSARSFIAFDVKRDPIDRIVMYLTRGPAFLTDLNEPGAAERDTLVLRAWKLALGLANEAECNYLCARCLEYILITINMAAIILNIVAKEDVTACLPILSGLCVAVLAKFNFTTRWAIAWLAAQDVVREIYLFRARAGDYHESDKGQRPQGILSGKLKVINNRCKHEDGLACCLTPFCPKRRLIGSRKVLTKLQPGMASESHAQPGVASDSQDDVDDGCSLVTVDNYVMWRLNPVIQRYKKQGKVFSVCFQSLQFLTMCLSSVGAFLVYLELQRFLPVTILAATACASVLAFEQFGPRAKNMQDARKALESLRTDWESMSLEERICAQQSGTLIKDAEDAINAEVAAFIHVKKEASRKSSRSDNADEV